MARILIIDDEEPVCSMLRAMLERAGYEVMEAHDGSEGLQRYQETPADVIVLDLIMPRQEGLETIPILRRLNPQVKILAISGGGQTRETHYLQIAAALGAQRTLAKPFRMQELLDTVHDLVQSA